MNGKSNQSTVVKVYEFIIPGIDKEDYLLEKIIEACRKKHLLLFEYRCVSVIKFTNVTNNEGVILPNSLGYMGFKSEHFRLKKTKTQETMLSNLMKL